MEIEDIPVAVDTAIPCGLIVNELIANALRHAFPDGRKGCISLGLHARPGGSLELTVADDGCGFPSSASTARGRTLGLWLVDLLASQLGAAVERSHANGTRYRLLFQDAAAPPPAP
jgi:two-component sensor histidine kinase